MRTWTDDVVHGFVMFIVRDMYNMYGGADVGHIEIVKQKISTEWACLIVSLLWLLCYMELYRPGDDSLGPMFVFYLLTHGNYDQF